MKLSKNLAAPVFNLKDVYGRNINLEEYIDKKVLIAFFRHAGCPFCNLRVHTLTTIYEDVKKQGMEMIFFFESKESIILRSSFHRGVSPVPIISDPEKIWYNHYGLETSGFKSTAGHLTGFIQAAIKAKINGLPVHPMADGESINTIPAEFLVGKGLIIKELHYSQKLTDRLNLDTIKNFALASQSEIVS